MYVCVCVCVCEREREGEREKERERDTHREREREEVRQGVVVISHAWHLSTVCLFEIYSFLPGKPCCLCCSNWADWQRLWCQSNIICQCSLKPVESPPSELWKESFSPDIKGVLQWFSIWRLAGHRLKTWWLKFKAAETEIFWLLVLTTTYNKSDGPNTFPCTFPSCTSMSSQRLKTSQAQNEIILVASPGLFFWLFSDI